MFRIESRQHDSVTLIDDVIVADINVFTIYVPTYECKILISGPGRVMLKGSCMRLAVSFLWVCFVVAMDRLAAKHTAASYCRCGYQKRGDIVAELLSQCKTLHFSLCTLEPCEVQHCIAKILQWRQNDCCLE